MYDIVTDEFTDSSHKPYLKSQNQTLHGYIIYNWSYGFFVIFLPILAETWLPWKPPLDPCNQKCLLWIGRPRKPPVISNHFLAISHSNAFIAILVPKLVAMVTPCCPLCTGVSQMNSSMAQTLSQNQTLYGYVAYKWSYGHFCDFWAFLAKIWLPWQRPLDPCNHKCLPRIGRPQKPYPWTKNFVNSCYTSEVMSIRRFATSLALRE